MAQGNAHLKDNPSAFIITPFRTRTHPQPTNQPPPPPPDCPPQEVLGDAPEPTADHIPKLVYIEACFREALRLNPPVSGVARDAAADTIIKVGWAGRGARGLLGA